MTLPSEKKNKKTPNESNRLNKKGIYEFILSEKKKVFSYNRMPTNKCRRNDRIGKPPLATIVVVINSAKKHHWMLN